MSNPCYHQAAGGLNTCSNGLRMHYDKQQKRIYLQRWTSINFLVYTIPASKSQLDPIHLSKATHTCNHQSWWILFRTLPEIVLVMYICILCCSSISPPHVHLPFLKNPLVNLAVEHPGSQSFHQLVQYSSARLGWSIIWSSNCEG